MRPSKYFYDKPLPKYLDSKTVSLKFHPLKHIIPIVTINMLLQANWAEGIGQGWYVSAIQSYMLLLEVSTRYYWRCWLCFDIEENTIIEAFVHFGFDIVAISTFTSLFLFRSPSRLCLWEKKKEKYHKRKIKSWEREKPLSCRKIHRTVDLVKKCLMSAINIHLFIFYLFIFYVFAYPLYFNRWTLSKEDYNFLPLMLLNSKSCLWIEPYLM